MSTTSEPGPSRTEHPDGSETAAETGERSPWRGRFEPYVVGDPGAAPAAVVPLPPNDFPGHHDITVDGVTVLGPGAPVGLCLRAASVRGLSHRYYGKVRQDSYGYRVTPEGTELVVAVADGVSAGRFSHLAAEIVTGDGCRLLADRLGKGGEDEIDWDSLLVDLAARILDRGRAELAREGADADEVDDREVARSIGTTALFAVVGLQPDASGALPVRAAALGDSRGWLMTPTAPTPWRCLLGEASGKEEEVASSATYALPMLRTPSSVTGALAEEDVLVLVSDGVGDPLGSGEGDVGRFLAESWARPPGPLGFAAQVDFARKSFDDDRTAVALWRV